MTPLWSSLGAKVVPKFMHSNIFPSIQDRSITALLSPERLKRPCVLARTFRRVRANLRQPAGIAGPGILSGSVLSNNTDVDSAVGSDTKKGTAAQHIREHLMAPGLDPSPAQNFNQEE